MNGARGVVVAILYTPGPSAPGSASANAERTDGSTIADIGSPTATLGAFPRGELACPTPEYVVVHFPGYKGPACFHDLPKTWVPVPCAEVRHKSLQSIVRATLQLRLAWALTFHKSQGITSPEGTIVSFDGCKGHAPVAKHGMAFVAWTRATSWSRMVFTSCLLSQTFWPRA